MPFRLLSFSLFLFSAQLLAAPQIVSKIAPVQYPWKIECNAEDAKLVIYTRLEKEHFAPTTSEPKIVWSHVREERKEEAKRDAPRADEALNGFEDDYYEASYDTKNYYYRGWDCDCSENYEFPISALALELASPLKTRAVKGTWISEIRDEETKTPLSCQAFYR